MGAAYYVVLNTDAPDFDTTVDGKALARNSTQIDLIAGSLGFKALDGYFSISPADARLQMADLLGIEDENNLPPENEEALKQMPPEEWYDAQHGVDWATQIANYIRENPGSVKDPDKVLADLDQMKQVMTDAVKRGLKWHLLVDY